MRGSGIYQILNAINGKRYIGSAASLRQRWMAHRSALRLGRHCNGHLQRAWNLYGGKTFVFSVLEYVSDIEGLVEREQYYMDALRPEYNLSPTAGSSLGLVRGPQSEEHRRKISEANTGRMWSEEARQKLSAALRGENNPNAELTEQGVREIKLLLEEGVLLLREIAAMYGVSRKAIGHIKRGRRWAHLAVLAEGESNNVAASEGLVAGCD